MARPSEATQLAVELAWSLWGELGVPAPVRRHGDWLVVPEPLIVFTAALGEHDRRLRDNAVAWCRGRLPLVSTRALRHTLTAERWDLGCMADFAATMSQVAGVRWPGAEAGTPFSVTADPPALSVLAAPSQLALRMRALLGVGSRAEILRVLLTGPSQPFTIADLARAAHATKRQTTETVEQLQWSGVVAVDRSRQPHRVRLRQGDELVGLLGAVPRIAPDWGPLLRLVAGIVAVLEAVEGLPDDVAGAELHRALRDRADQLARLGLDAPPAQPGATYRARAERWCLDLLMDLASGAKPLGWSVHRS